MVTQVTKAFAYSVGKNTERDLLATVVLLEEVSKEEIINAMKDRGVFQTDNPRRRDYLSEDELSTLSKDVLIRLAVAPTSDSREAILGYIKTYENLTTRPGSLAVYVETEDRETRGYAGPRSGTPAPNYDNIKDPKAHYSTFDWRPNGTW